MPLNSAKTESSYYINNHMILSEKSSWEDPQRNTPNRETCQRDWNKWYILKSNSEPTEVYTAGKSVEFLVNSFTISGHPLSLSLHPKKWTPNLLLMVNSFLSQVEYVLWLLILEQMRISQSFLLSFKPRCRTWLVNTIRVKSSLVQNPSLPLSNRSVAVPIASPSQKNRWYPPQTLG